MRATQILLSALGLGLLLSGCSNAPEASFSTVTLNGNVKMIAGPLPQGKIRFRIYVLESLTGELAHPLEEVEDFESDSGRFTHTFEFPLDKGTGLAVHAWLDTDGDGLFCTPDQRTDPSGLAWQTETPEGDTDITIVLTENCRAANWFYPPAP